MMGTPGRHRVHKMTLQKFLGSVSILFVLFLTIPAGAQDYFAPHNILKFADYLYRQGDYRRSAAEYQRYLITVGANDSVFYSAALAYKMARNLTAAETYFSEIPREFGGSPLLSRAYLHANNEVGTIQPIAEITKIAHEKGVPVHTDASQAVGKIPTNVNELGVDLLTIAG
ncbi:MAG TPA: aminotransferase class V-fold PLP-dependent enzyme, partial [Bacteroidetes bacterium]|nr:aminotransferase class V-fold PLP-dependent enzyme [Bacteroidota bacterium]